MSGRKKLDSALRVVLLVGAVAGCENISDDEYSARLAWGAPSPLAEDSGVVTTDDCPEGKGTWYADADADGYGDPTAAVQACEQPSGTVTNAEDCDDTDPLAAIPVEWFLDSDGDGVGGETVTMACQAPVEYVATTGDCNDDEPAVYPGATEICDALDNDCNDLVDDDDPDVDLSGVDAAFRDADGDGVGSDEDVLYACALPSGYTLVSGDCDDGEPLASPELDEVCDDGIDNDCDGTANDCGLPASLELNSSADARVYTDQAFVSHGERVVAVGDMSGDGLPDLAVSVPGEAEGTVYVLNDIASLSGDVETESSPWARLSGPGTDGRFGFQLADLGDTNADGLSDLIVGDPYDDTAAADAGTAWLLAGPISGELDVGSAGLPLYGESADAKAGWSVHSAGDTNADGVADLLIGAFAESSTGDQAGTAYVVEGPVTAAMSLADASWLVRGRYQDRLGFSVTGGVDLNSDGVSDVVVGADRADPSGVFNAGTTMVFYGPVSGVSEGADADALIHGVTASAYVGYLVSGGGDLDGDGVEDLLVGATGENGGGTSGAGAVFVWSGPVSGTMDTSGAIARLDGVSSGDTVGASLAIVSDMSWDGQSELLLGARGVDQGSGGRDGGAYLWFGPVSGTVGLASADIIMAGSDAEQAGASVAGAADFNADGLGDVVVGAPSGNQAYVVFGGGL